MNGLHHLTLRFDSHLSFSNLLTNIGPFYWCLFSYFFIFVFIGFQSDVKCVCVCVFRLSRMFSIFLNIALSFYLFYIWFDDDFIAIFVFGAAVWLARGVCVYPTPVFGVWQRNVSIKCRLHIYLHFFVVFFGMVPSITARYCCFRHLFFFLVRYGILYLCFGCFWLMLRVSFSYWC